MDIYWFSCSFDLGECVQTQALVNYLRILCH